MNFSGQIHNPVLLKGLLAPTNSKGQAQNALYSQFILEEEQL
jgi:hypothetical protein